MLDGDDEAIHSSTIAQQPQVWSMKEHHHPRIQSFGQPFEAGTAGRRSDDRPPGGSTADVNPPIALGPSLNGHLPAGIEFSEQTWQDTGNTRRPPRSPRSSAPSPAPMATRFSPPTLLASYPDPSTGLPTRSVYATWVEESDTIADAASELGRRQIRHVAGTRVSSRGDLTTASYVDPYDFRSPDASQPSSRPSSRRNSFGSGPTEDKPPSHSDSTNDFADATPQDVVLTGKVRGVI